MNTTSRKLRVALVSNNYTPYCGGVVSSINAQAAALRKDGHTVRVITLDFLGNRHDDPNYVIRIATPVKFKHRQNHYAVPWFMVTQLKRAFEAIEADIVHVHHPFLLGVTAVRAARLLKMPTLFTYHTLYEAYAHYVPLPENTAKRLITRLVKSFCNSVDGIIVPSTCMEQNLRAQSVTTDCFCIPSPLQRSFLDIPPTVKRRAKLERFQLLTVVRFTKEKNVPFVLEVFKDLDDRFYLTLVGYGAEYENLRAYAYEHLQLSPERLRFVLKPPRDQLLAHYKNADLFLFPSTSDTQGLVLAEAMACSTPVIALPGPGQNDIVRNGKNGFIVKSKQEMLNRIVESAERTGQFTCMQKAAWLTAKNYSPDQYLEQLLDVYNQFSANSRS